MKKIAVVLVVALTACNGSCDPGDGEKIGQIVKLSKRGLLNKTWEAQLIRGGMSNGSGSFGVAPFDFTIESEADAVRIRGFMENQTELKVYYRGESTCSWLASASNCHFLTSAEPLHSEPEKKP